MVTQRTSILKRFYNKKIPKNIHFADMLSSFKKTLIICNMLNPNILSNTKPEKAMCRKHVDLFLFKWKQIETLNAMKMVLVI